MRLQPIQDILTDEDRRSISRQAQAFADNFDARLTDFCEHNKLEPHVVSLLKLRVSDKLSSHLVKDAGNSMSEAVGDPTSRALLRTHRTNILMQLDEIIGLFMKSG